MKVYLLDAICRHCGTSEVPLFRVCYESEPTALIPGTGSPVPERLFPGQRRFEGPYCEACARSFVGWLVPSTRQESASV